MKERCLEMATIYHNGEESAHFVVGNCGKTIRREVDF